MSDSPTTLFRTDLTKEIIIEAIRSGDPTLPSSARFAAQHPSGHWYLYEADVLMPQDGTWCVIRSAKTRQWFNILGRGPVIGRWEDSIVDIRAIRNASKEPTT